MDSFRMSWCDRLLYSRGFDPETEVKKITEPVLYDAICAFLINSMLRSI